MQQRGESGVHYTPRSIIDPILDHTLDPFLDRICATRDPLSALATVRICDPACGAGYFLIRAAERIQKRLAGVPRQRLGDVLASVLHGMDIDPEAVRLAQAGLAACTGSSKAFRVETGDALLADGPRERFDLVVGNPPFIDSEATALRVPERREAIRARYSTARGNWDEYVPFVELASRLVKPGGVFAMVTPARVLSAEYARALRAHLLTMEPVVVLRFEDAEVWTSASIHTVAVACRKPVGRGDRVESVPVVSVPSGERSGLSVGGDGVWGCGARGGLRLGDVAEVRDGATTAEAYAIRELVRDAAVTGDGDVRLVNTGTIDPYRVMWGERAIRYLGFRGLWPVVDVAGLRRVAPRRVEQALREKVLVAGLSRRIEAVACAGGVLCGKSAVQVLPEDGVSVDALAAWLNSGPVGEWYRGAYSTRGFGPGSMAIGRRQLEAVPVAPLEMLGEGGRLAALGRALGAARGEGDALLGEVDAIARGVLDEVDGDGAIDEAGAGCS